MNPECEPDANEEDHLFVQCLTDWEWTALTDYLHFYPDSIYALNQSPENRPTYATDQV